MFEERAEVFVFLHRADEFGQVFQPAGGLGRFLRLPHRGVAALVEDLPRELGVGQLARHAAPARHVADEVAERAARRGGQLVGVEDARRRGGQRDALGAGELVDLRHRLVAEPALGDVDDAFEGEVVGGLRDDAQIRERVADFGAFVEAEAADDAVGHADRDEAVLELARLVLRADEDGDVVEALPLRCCALDLLADAARFLGAVPHAEHLDLLARVVLGPQVSCRAGRYCWRSRRSRRRGCAGWSGNSVRAG